MEWQPEPGSLQQLIQLLNSTQSPDNAVQRQNNQRLEELRKVPDFINYLLFVLVVMKDESPTVRVVAGLLLKNNVRQDFATISPQILDYIKRKSVEAINDPDIMVRHTLGTVIAAIVSLGKVRGWPEILPQLMQLLDSNEYAAVEGAWNILSKICDECTKELEQPLDDGTRPLEIMLPRFISFFRSESPVLRECAIETTTLFVRKNSASMQPHIDSFVVELFQRANDENAGVLKVVCKAIVALIESRPDKLMPELENVVNYMIHTSQHDDTEIAMEACEFWLSFCEQEEMVESLKPFLDRVIPTLMKGMVYSEEDLLTLDNDDEDAVVPDSEQDIKPRHHRARTHDYHGGSVNPGSASSETGSIADGNNDADDEDYDDEHDSDDDDDDVYSGWNLRKCSAASLDVISTAFGDQVLEYALPVLKDELGSDDWRIKEAGILALGAIAEGCMNGMREHMPNLLPYLIQMFKHEKALVRSIACWSASRYGRWALCDGGPDSVKVYFEPLLAGLLSTMMDKNKRVQEAACSAFATIEEVAGPYMVPYIEHVLETLLHAFAMYQRKNLIILYDAIGTLAEAVGPELNKPQIVQKLVPPVVERWEDLPTDDHHIFPLTECLSAVALSLGMGFEPFAQPTYDRCVQTIGETLQTYQQAPQDSSIELPDMDLVIVSLDFISAIVQAMGESSRQLVSSHNGVVLNLVGMCMVLEPVYGARQATFGSAYEAQPTSYGSAYEAQQSAADCSGEVRQSAFALLGDLAICCYPLLDPQLDTIMQQVIIQIDRSYYQTSVCNNAIWSVGEIALKAGGERMKDYVQQLLERLIPMLNNPNTVPTLAENAAITIGRLGVVCPNLVAPSLEMFAETWCAMLAPVKDNDEKESAFHGMMTMISINPQGISKAFLYFCRAAINWQNLNSPLMPMFKQTFAGLKQLAGDEWQASLSQLDPASRNILESRFELSTN